MSKRAPVVLRIANCSACPFCYSGEDSIDDVYADWACTAVETKQGWYRKLTRRDVRTRNGWKPPPKWCPLRSADRLVTLRLP